MIGTRAEAPDFRTGNSQLLMDYREALIKAFDLGESIKAVYAIVPPKVMHDECWELPGGHRGNNFVIGLTVS